MAITIVDRGKLYRPHKYKQPEPTDMYISKQGNIVYARVSDALTLASMLPKLVVRCVCDLPNCPGCTKAPRIKRRTNAEK